MNSSKYYHHWVSAQNQGGVPYTRHRKWRFFKQWDWHLKYLRARANGIGVFQEILDSVTDLTGSTLTQTCLWKWGACFGGCMCQNRPATISTLPECAPEIVWAIFASFSFLSVPGPKCSFLVSFPTQTSHKSGVLLVTVFRDASRWRPPVRRNKK